MRGEDPACGGLPPPEEMDAAGDGFVRFHCPCGRRLKVPAKGGPRRASAPTAGGLSRSLRPRGPRQSPGKNRYQAIPKHGPRKWTPTTWPAWKNGPRRIWPIPIAPATRATKTTSLVPVLPGTDPVADTAYINPATPPNSAVKFEAGMRICPRCKKPIHLGASTCRACGTPVPRQ